MSLLIRRYAGPFWLRRRWLAKTQWATAERLRQIQLDLLQKLVRHAYRTIPYYREVMDSRGLRPEDIRSLEDIRRFPILTRSDVLDAGDKLVSRKYPRFMLRPAYTGGTTGTPVRLQRNLFSIGNEHAFVRRQFDWAGIGMGDRCAYLTGRLIAKPDQTEGLWAYDPFMRELILSTYHLSPVTAEKFVEPLRKYRVQAVVGYPSAVALLARACLEKKAKIRLRAALTSSETMTDQIRQVISEAFGCPVYDFYGGAERVCYIHTCDHGSYHVVPEYGLTELVAQDQSDPRSCKVVATGFWNMAMPLIRYEMGDVVVRSDRTCSCGRAFPVVERIAGREVDVIRTPSGRQLGSAILTHLLYGTANIVESQIIQDALDHVTIEYVPAKEFGRQDLDAFRKLIKMHLPTELKVELKQVEAVERTSSGKVRPVVSRI